MHGVMAACVTGLAVLAASEADKPPPNFMFILADGEFIVALRDICEQICMVLQLVHNKKS